MKMFIRLAVCFYFLTFMAVAEAATWRHCIPASAMMVGGTANFYGTATRSTGANGEPYISFVNTADPTATFEFSIPSWLTAITIDARVFGRINSITTTNNVCVNIEAIVSTAGDTDSTWGTNDGNGVQPTTQSLTPLTVANATIKNGTLLTDFTPTDQGTAAGCASVAACADAPARGRFQRITTGCTNNDGAAFELIKLCIYGDM